MDPMLLHVLVAAAGALVGVVLKHYHPNLLLGAPKPAPPTQADRIEAALKAIAQQPAAPK